MITELDLEAVPLEHRQTVARWLLDRAGQVQPSWVLDPQTTATIQSTLAGAAADLVNPLSEDSTVDAANRTIADLQAGRKPRPLSDYVRGFLRLATRRGHANGVACYLWVALSGRTYVAPLQTPWPTEAGMHPNWNEVTIP